MTTVAGVGGGLTLIAALSGFTPLDPKEVVGLTAPVLLLGNAQRAWLFREHIDWPVTRWFLLGGIPATVAGAIALPALPARAIQIGIAILLLVFVAERIVRRHIPPSVSVSLHGFAGVGLVTGVLSATVGGSGPFSAPFFHGWGLTKEPFVATNATCNGTQHAIKTVAYGFVGVLTTTVLPAATVAAITVMVGNWIGGHVLYRLSEQAFVNLLLAALTIAAVRLLFG